MNRKRKGANSALKPPALPKPTAPTTSTSTSTTTPATASAMPSRVSPPPKAAQNVPPQPKVAQQPARTPAQAPRPPAPPSRTPAPNPNLSAMKSAIPAGKPGPSQRRVITRSDRVRAVWMEFEETWVRQRQQEVEIQLEQLLATAEKNSRVKGPMLEKNRERIVNTMRREFVMAARVEWESRLEKAGLVSEDWMDMTPEEMFAVEQVLSFEEEEEDSGVFAMSQHAASAVPGTTAVKSSPPSHPPNGRTPQPSAPVAAQQKTQSSSGQSWGSWATSLLGRQPTVAEVPEEPAQPQKATSGWTAKNGAIIEDLRTSPKAPPAPQPPLQTWPPVARAPQAAAKAPRPVTPPAPASPSHGLLAYPVPILATMPAFDGAAASDAEFITIVDNLYVNSIRQFHRKAADEDANLARQLRKPMPASEREWIIRAHMMHMEQIARDIVDVRNTHIDLERQKRGFSDGSANPTTSAPAAKAAPLQLPGGLPGAFPEESIRVSPVQEPEPAPQPELDSDVDEVIEILPKGKAAKKKGKKAAETKATSNGRSTPTPAAPATARAATPSAKVAPAVVEKKAALPASGWGAKLAAAPAGRPASPAPINTKVAPVPSPSPAVNVNAHANANANGRNTPAPGMSPWEAMQAAKAAKGGPASETKPPSPPNGMWAPPVAKARSGSKNPYAPTRPSRLAQVSEPESPEPPSPPPTREPTGKDYVAWFAGSSSEDEGGRLSEDGDEEDDEDEDDEDESGGSGGAAFGGLLASLAGNSPWAMFGEGTGGPAQKERGRTASPARGRGVNATPTPGLAAGGRFGTDMNMGGEWARWGGGPPAGASGWGAAPGMPGSGSGWGAGPSGFGLGPPNGGFGAGPAAAYSKGGPGRHGHGQWQSEEDDLDDVLDLASKTLDRGTGGRGGGANIEEAMAMFVTAQKARETLSTPVGGRAPGGWRR